MRAATRCGTTTAAEFSKSAPNSKPLRSHSQWLFHEVRALPIYRQIVDQVERAIASGQAKTGDELPSVRALAQAHAINSMTVSKAYSLLEAQGLLERRRGIGMLIAAQPLRAGQRQRLDLLEPALLADLERVVTHVAFIREGRLQLVDEWDALVENLRLLKLDTVPQTPGVVHSRSAAGREHVLVDLRSCNNADRPAWAKGQVLRMDDLFEELNA